MNPNLIVPGIKIFNNTPPLDKFTVCDLTRVVADILGDPHFLSQMSKMMSKQVAVNLDTSIEATCLKCIEPLTHKMEKQSKLIDNLLSRVSVLEKDLEEQQQYSRRTNLRFNNVNLPSNRGKVIYPIDTDSLVLNICNDSLGQAVSLDDIGRTHTIGQIRDGKASIIARFNSYHKRHIVYSNKHKLKNHPDRTFISENLTRHRFELVRKLNFHRKRGEINSYWTQDGRIIVKPTEQSHLREFKTISTESDIYRLRGVPPYDENEFVIENESQNAD